MNETGKLKHRCHILLFLRGDTPKEDTLLEHLVTTKREVNREGHNSPLCRLVRKHLACRRQDAEYHCWLVDEPGWRELGLAGRPLR